MKSKSCCSSFFRRNQFGFLSGAAMGATKQNEQPMTDSFLISFSPGTSVRGVQIKSKSCGSFFLRRNQLDFILGQHLERQNEQSKADWPRRNDQSVRRLLENYRNDPESIEHRAASGKRRKTPAGCSGEGQAVLCVQTEKKRPFSLTQNQPPKTGKVAA